MDRGYFWFQFAPADQVQIADSRLNLPHGSSTTPATSPSVLSSIRASTLVLSGDADPLSPVRVGEFLRDRIPSAELHVVAGGGHWMAQDDPDRIAGVIGRAL